MKTASLHCLLGTAGSAAIVSAMALFNAIAGGNLPVQLMASVLVPTTAAISAVVDPLSKRLQDEGDGDLQAALKQQILTEALVEKLVRSDTDARKYTQLPVAESPSDERGESRGRGASTAGEAPLSRRESPRLPATGRGSAPDGEVESSPEVCGPGLRLVPPTAPHESSEAPTSDEEFAARAIPFPLGKRSPTASPPIPAASPSTATANSPAPDRDDSDDDLWGTSRHSAV